MGETLFKILVVIMTIAVWLFYHSVFRVRYFNITKGIVGELLVSLLVGMTISVVIMKFWPIAIMVGGVGIYLFVKKK